MRGTVGKGRRWDRGREEGKKVKMKQARLPLTL